MCLRMLVIVAVMLMLPVQAADHPIDNKQSLKVTLRLIKKSSTPSLEAIAPYREALVLYHYRVVKPGIGRKTIKGFKEMGLEKGANLIVAHWGLYGKQDQLIDQHKPGRVRAMEIQLLKNFQDLQYVKTSNELTDESLTWPVYLDVEQHRLMKDPEAGEKYGLHTYKMRDLHQLRHQLKLFAVGDSRAHKGIKPDEFYPDENKKRIVAYNASYDSTGFGTAMTLMGDYAPHMPQLEWVVHAISTRAVKPGYRGREGVWNFVDGYGVRLDRENRFADWIPKPNHITHYSPDTYTWQALGTYGGLGAGSRGRSGTRPWGWESNGNRQRISSPKVWAARHKHHVQRPVDLNKAIDRQLLTAYEAILRKLRQQGVKVLAFIPPMCTEPHKSDYDSEDLTSRQLYKGIVEHLQGIAKRHDNFFFHDLHRFGDNGYPVNHFADDNHLNERGAVKLSQALEGLRQEHER